MPKRCYNLIQTTAFTLSDFTTIVSLSIKLNFGARPLPDVT